MRNSLLPRSQFRPKHTPDPRSLNARKYSRGLYQVGAMVLYTNRGLGVVDVPVRFCARPEITIYTLRSAV